MRQLLVVVVVVVVVSVVVLVVIVTVDIVFVVVLVVVVVVVLIVVVVMDLNGVLPLRVACLGVDAMHVQPASRNRALDKEACHDTTIPGSLPDCPHSPQ